MPQQGSSHLGQTNAISAIRTLAARPLHTASIRCLDSRLTCRPPVGSFPICSCQAACPSVRS